MTRGTDRRGVAAVWALVVVAVVSGLTAAAAARMMAARKHADAHRDRVQAGWLARAGYELAADRLLAAEGYTGEKAVPLAGGEVTVEVRPDPDAKGVYVVTSEARYRAVVARVERAVRRDAGPDGVRLTPR